MNFKLISILLSLFYTSTICQTVPKSVLASVIQDILSPKNTETATQLIKSVAGNRKVMLSDVPAQRVAINEANMPRAVVMAKRADGLPKTVMVQQNPEVAMPGRVIIQKNADIVMPKQVVLKKNGEIVMPTRVIVQKNGEGGMPNKVILRNPEAIMPTRVILQKTPEFAMPSGVIRQRSPEVVPSKVILQRNAEAPMPNGIVLQNNKIVARSVLPETKQPVIISPPKIVEYVLPQEKYCSTNPFLPVASPMSAVAPPTSGLLPPVLPTSRGQFLRKIPIPPPSL